MSHHLAIHSALLRVKRKLGRKISVDAPISDNIRDINRNVSLLHGLNAGAVDLEVVAYLCKLVDSPAISDSVLSSTILLHGLSVVYKLLRQQEEQLPIMDVIKTSIDSRLKKSSSLISQIYCKEYFLEYCHHAKDLLPYLYNLFQTQVIDYQYLLTNKQVLPTGALDVFSQFKPSDPLIHSQLTKLVRFGTNDALTCATLLSITSNHCPTWYLEYLLECLVQNSRFHDISMVNVVHNMLYIVYHFQHLKSQILAMVEPSIALISDKSSLIATGELIANCVPFDSVAWLYSFMDSSKIPLKSIMYISCGFISCHVDQPKTLDLAISQLLRVVTKQLKQTTTDASIKTLGKDLSLKITKELNEACKINKVGTLPHAMKSVASLTQFETDPLFVVVDVLSIIAEYIIGSCSNHIPNYLCVWQYNKKQSDAVESSLMLFQDVLRNLIDLALGQSNSIMNKQLNEVQNGPIHDALYSHVLDACIELANASKHSKFSHYLLASTLDLFEQKAWTVMRICEDMNLFKTYCTCFNISGEYNYSTVIKIAHLECSPLLLLLEKILSDNDSFLEALQSDLSQFTNAIPNYTQFISQFRAFWVFYTLFDFNSLFESSDLLSKIAFYSPVLFPAIISSEEQYKKTLDYNPYREHFSTDPRQILIAQSQLLNQFEGVYRQRLKQSIEVDVTYLTSVECLHLLSILDLELKRCSSGRIEIINYLAAFDLSTGAQAASTSYKHSQGFILFKSCLKAAIDKICKHYLQIKDCIMVHSMEQYNELVQQQALYCLFHWCCHPLVEVHTYSVNYLQALTNEHYFLKSNQSMLFMCLDLVQLCYKSTSSDAFYFTLPSRPSTSSSNLVLYLPDDLQHRQLLFNNLSQFLRQWISLESFNAIKDYIMQSYPSIDQHMGCLIAIEVLKQLKDVTLLNFESKLAMQSFQKGFIRNLPLQLDQFSVNALIKVNNDLLNKLHQAAEYQIQMDIFQLSKYLIWIPIKAFHVDCILTSIELWSWVIYKNTTIKDRFMSEVIKALRWTAINKMGIFNASIESNDPFRKTTIELDRHLPTACHAMFIKFLVDRVNPSLLFSKTIMDLLITIDQCKMSVHASCRPSLLLILLLGFKWYHSQTTQLNHIGITIMEYIYKIALYWFSQPMVWFDGINKYYPLDEMALCLELLKLVQSCNHPQFDHYNKVLIVFIQSELEHLDIMMNPLNCKSNTSYTNTVVIDASFIKMAFDIDVKLPYRLIQRFTHKEIPIVYKSLISNQSDLLVHFDEAQSLYFGPSLIIADPIHPLKAISFLSSDDPIVLQYALRSLQHYPISLVFQYIPQIVQLLRQDCYGYVEQFILRAAQSDAKFSHQIIWNLKANLYSDCELLIPDQMKPQFEKLLLKIVHLFNKEQLEYYQREFEFFSKVTHISKVLKPFVKDSKEFKKRKIDDELKKIKVDVGVYLPSSPESTVVDIDYNSGRPLQSHAKTPFMATFKIHSSLGDFNQAAIFKVGDDCRQDVLALQLIQVFKNIFKSANLNCYLFPYRVVASDVGCGVIEVIPNSASRDMIGREKINSLCEYFVSKFGNMHTIEYQQAKKCFWESMAAYSIVLYILQIKDRHNGNIMIDGQGHVVHIDFGFILDIAPGGIKFEGADFKLTTEMIQLMDNQSGLAFKRFKELTIKSFLALRPYAEEIIEMVKMMQESGLPCFKGKESVSKLRQRFKLELNQRDAAGCMMDIIDKSCENYRTVIYDSFQKQTNGIPY